MAPGIEGESDGIEEALQTTVRLAVMAGARLGSEIARAREERLREQRRVDEREAERLAQRFEAEKRAAVAEVSQVHRADWWERADAERIGQTYATARAWVPEAEEAARAERKMREELRDRYGINLDRTDAGAVASQIERGVEAWRRRLEEQRWQEAGRERRTETTERAEAAVLLDQAARDDRQADVAREDERRADAEARQVEDDRERNPWLSAGQEPQQMQESPEELRQRAQEADRRSRDSEARSGQSTGEAERLYDSADRRAAEVRALEAKGIDPEIARNRMHADTGAGKPAALATAGARRGRGPKARKAVGRSAQVERTGVER